MVRAAICVLVTVMGLLVPAGAQAIVGGRPATTGEFPWLAAVVEQGDGAATTAGCGGTLITPSVVLTAGHCVTGFAGALDPTRAGRVILDRTDLRSSAGESHAVAGIVRHPFFDNGRLRYDVALLKLAEPASAPTLALASANTPWRAGQPATVAGWGSAVAGGKRSPVLRAASVPLWSHDRCTRGYGALHVPSLMLCAASPAGGRDVCDGDSGGPLTVAGPGGARRLIGVASFGHAGGCGSRRYATNFASVAAPLLRGWVTRRAAALERGDPDRVRPRLSVLARSGSAVRFALSEPAEVVISITSRGGAAERTTTRVMAGAPGANTGRLPAIERRWLTSGATVRLRVFATDAAGNVTVRDAP